MKLFLLKQLYENNNLPEAEMHEAMDFLMLLNEHIDFDIDAINEELLDQMIEFMVKHKLNDYKNFVVLMRYYRLIDRKDLFIHLTKYTGMIGVIENIIDRLKRIHGHDLADKILKDYQVPVLGTSPYQLPDYARDLTIILEQNLSEDEANLVLSGNNHSIPEKAMIPEKIEYENSKNLETYLKERHQRKVKELTEHYQQNKVWFEQIITQDVIDFVKANQEVLSARLDNDKLYITKIPYDTLNFLKSEDLTSKKYYACHCPFAREAIKAKRTDIPERFCYCSAGFAKYPFEVILGQELKIKVIETALGNGTLCKFEIDLKNVNFKK